MPAATVPFPSAERDLGIFQADVAAATSVFAGTLAALNADGEALPAADTAGLRVAGRFEDSKDNSSGSAGDLTATIKPGIFRFDSSSTGALDASHVGQECFVEDDTTVSADPGTNGIVAGRVAGVDSDGVWVDTRANLLALPGGAHDADGRTLTAADSGKLLTNLGASGAATFVLPPAVPGLEFLFAVKVAQELRIDPDGTETIELPSTAAQQAAGKYIVADAIGEFVHLRCLAEGDWAVVNSAGTWTAEA